jgi:hypothetical protein
VQDYCYDVETRILLYRREDHQGQELKWTAVRAPGEKIRNMEQQRVPIMAVVGMREMETNELARHSRKPCNLGSSGVEDLFQEIVEEMAVQGDYLVNLTNIFHCR